MNRNVIRGQLWTYERMLYFPTSEYAHRRSALWNAWKMKKPILLLGRQAEASGAFTQWPTFEYFTGFREPGAFLVILPRGRSRFETHFFIHPITDHVKRWEGNRFDPASAKSRSTLGVDFVHSTEHWDHFLKSKLGRKREIGVCFDVDRYNKIQRKTPQSQELHQFLKKANLTGASLTYEVNELRRIKSAREIECLRRADLITGRSIQGVLENWRSYRNERDIHGDILGGFMRGGADGPAYEPIVGAGFNATVLHYRTNDFPLSSSQLVLMDVGSRYHGYCADITRDFPRSGRFTKRQREVYEIVLASQKKAISCVKPGATWGELNDAAWGHLKKHGFERWHGVGHFLGMDVHDVGDYSKPLEPGVVITIEPGVYLPDEGIGIRIEDDVLVTSTGCKVLSSMIPKEVDTIEGLLRRR